LQQHIWLKQNSSEDFRNYHFDHWSQVFKKIPEGQEKGWIR
jgi:hypothetical protein